MLCYSADKCSLYWDTTMIWMAIRIFWYLSYPLIYILVSQNDQSIDGSVCTKFMAVRIFSCLGSCFVLSWKNCKMLVMKLSVATNNVFINPKIFCKVSGIDNKKLISIYKRMQLHYSFNFK